MLSVYKKLFTFYHHDRSQHRLYSTRYEDLCMQGIILHGISNYEKKVIPGTCVFSGLGITTKDIILMGPIENGTNI